MNSIELQELQKEFQGLFSAMKDVGKEPRVLTISKVKSVGEVQEITMYSIDFRDKHGLPFTF